MNIHETQFSCGKIHEIFFGCCEEEMEEARTFLTIVILIEFEDRSISSLTAWRQMANLFLKLKEEF
jgi:hypothetical protein